MMKMQENIEMNLIEGIKKLTTPKIFLLFLILTIIVVVAMGSVTPQILALSGGAPILDIRPGYTFADVKHLFTVLGEQDRQLYTTLQVLDLIFPLAYGMTLTLALTSVITRLFPEGHARRRRFPYPSLA